jgi:phosphatidate cytidylyltransferase
MTPASADRPGSRDPGTEPLPRFGARVAEPSEPAQPSSTAGPDDTVGWPRTHARSDSDDTGPVPIVGDRPAPPATGPRPAVPQPDDAALPSSGDPALPTTERPPGRAGRDLRAAIGVGVGLGAVIVGSLLLWRPAFLGVLTAAVVVGVLELTRALQNGGFRPPLVPVLVGAVAMQVLAWTRGPTGLVTGFLATALAVLLWRLADGPRGYLRDASAGVLVALYVPLLAGFAALLLVPDDGATRVLVFIATVVASDVGGYVAGVLLGKHPMAPSISPKKSWEGMGGSVLACMLVATPIIALALDGPWWGGAVFGAALAVSATIGDLGESLIKRDLGIKDMGNLLPGHGGIMDRLDSLLPSAAVAYLLLSLLAPV